MARPSGPRSARPTVKRSTVCVALLATTANAFSLSPRSALSLLSSSSNAHLYRRQDSNATSVPAPISIGPSQYWDGNDGAWSTFPLEVGSGRVSGAQTIRVLPSTSGGAVYSIGPEGCPAGYVEDCADKRGGIFSPNSSLTWIPNSIFQTGLGIEIGYDVAGDVGFDTVSVGWQGSGGPTNDHSIVWNLASDVHWLGLFGLNPRPTNFTTYTSPQTSYLQYLYDSNQIPSLSWGYTAGAQYQLDAVFGSLTFGGYDANRIMSNNITFPFYEDISRDLSVNMGSIRTNFSIESASAEVFLDEVISIFIDSTVADIWLPEDVCELIQIAYGLIWDDDYSIYTINDTQREVLAAFSPSMSFTFGPSPVAGGDESVTITLPYAAFEKQLSFPRVENDTYYFPLQRATNASQYTLGRTFLQEAYVLADYQRGNFSVYPIDWNNPDVKSTAIRAVYSDEMLELIDSSSSSLSTGAIAGIAVGAAAAVAIIAVAIWFFLRRRRQQRRAEQEAAEAEKAGMHGSNASSSTLNGSPTVTSPKTPFTPTSADGSTVGGTFATIDGELPTSSEIVEADPTTARWEMGTESEQIPQELESSNGTQGSRTGYGSSTAGSSNLYSGSTRGGAPMSSVSGTSSQNARAQGEELVGGAYWLGDEKNGRFVRRTNGNGGDDNGRIVPVFELGGGNGEPSSRPQTATESRALLEDAELRPGEEAPPGYEPADAAARRSSLSKD